MSSLLGNFHAILIGVCVIYVVRATCPPEWRSWRDSCYILLEEKLSWLEAMRVCWRPQSSLVVPGTPEENDMIYQRPNECLENECTLWVGCRHTAYRGTWCIREKRAVASQDLIVNQSPKSGCLFMPLMSHGKWQVAENCSEKKRVMCEMPRQVHVYSLTMASDGRVKPQCPRGHGIKNVTVNGVIECGAACWAEPRCRSFNLWQGGLHKICQLNNATILASDEGDIIYDECNYFGL